MFSVPRRALLAFALVVPALFVFGCGGEEEVDPYVYGTLDQVTRGFVESENFLFEIDAPDFVFVQGNTGIARSGNHLEVIVGDDLENRAPSFQGKLLGVQKFFSPYVWLMVKRVRSADGLSVTELDSVTNPVLPHFTQVNLEEVSGFDLGTLRWNKKKAIEDMADAEVQGVGVVQYLPDHEAPEPAADETVAEGEDAVSAEPAMAWYLKAESSDALFKITNVTPSLEFAFRLLEAEGLPFVGVVKIGAPYEYVVRKKTKVSAPIEVRWLKYANRYLAP